MVCEHLLWEMNRQKYDLVGSIKVKLEIVSYLSPDHCLQSTIRFRVTICTSCVCELSDSMEKLITQTEYGSR